MKKLRKIGILALILWGIIWGGTVLSDRQDLDEGLIRLHVIANSDAEADQALKLRVRDEVLDYLNGKLDHFESRQEAEAFLKTHLKDLENRAQKVLEQAGISDRVQAFLDREEYPVREYDTFSLPSGIYHSLRLVIGEGAGKNWWCVVFPEFCVPVSGEGLEAVSSGAGFSDSLTRTIANPEDYQIRFWVLDFLGRVRSFFENGACFLD